MWLLLNPWVRNRSACSLHECISGCVRDFLRVGVFVFACMHSIYCVCSILYCIVCTVCACVYFPNRLWPLNCACLHSFDVFVGWWIQYMAFSSLLYEMHLLYVTLCFFICLCVCFKSSLLILVNCICGLCLLLITCLHLDDGWWADSIIGFFIAR